MVDIKTYVAIALLISLIGFVTGDCPFPKKNIANGRYLYESPHHVNLTVAPENYLLRFRCSPGFTMKGSKAIVCISSKWNDRVPSCLKMKCAEPPKVPNANYTLHSGVNKLLTIGTTATYACDPGYELENSTDSVLTCTLYSDINDVQWKGATPSCVEKGSCLDPGVSPDGKRDGNCCFIGDSLEFSCKEEFEVVGKNKIECLPGGSWSAPRPLCKPDSDHCDPPPTIPHGVTKGDKEGDYYRPYDEVEVLCQTGYRYSGSTEYIMCEEETGWEEEFEECVESFCETPEPLANGTIPEIESSNMTVYPFNFELTYVCDKGFRLIGDSWRFCDSRGWSGKSPKCEPIYCPDPGVPEHGTRIGNSFEIGDKVIFVCFTGFELIGSFERYCMPNGQWNNELARCDHSNNYCADPGIPVNGMKNSSNYNMGEIIGFSCYGGYTLVGSEVRECLPSREWSGTETKCFGPYDFDNSAKISDILKKAVAKKETEQRRKLEEYHKAMSNTWHNGTMIMRLGRALDINYPGRLIFYFAFDVSGSVREENFKKSVDFAKAIVKKVGITENGARVAALTFSSKAETQFTPLDYKTTEDVLAAFDRLNYTGGGTAANSALTLIREELIPLTQEWLSKKGMKSVIFILTDGKANMGGDPKAAAELLKQAGVEIYCIGVTDSVLQDSLYKIASDPKDEHVFILQNYLVLSYLIEEITNGTIDYSKCGLGVEKYGQKTGLGKVVGGGQATDPWPWMAALYFVQPGLPPEFQCGGSVIHESFILTAAHCLYKKNSAKRVEKEVIVKLGLTDIKNQSALQEFEVEKIITHPKYNPKGTFDFDIALLQLKRPIEFSALIRPVCLPPRELPPDTSFYKPGQFALAIGWGHTGVVYLNQFVPFKPVDQLKEVRLPIQSQERCKRNVQERQLEGAFTERMFCAGDGRGGNDTCQGDSGGPLMQSLSNEDGVTYYTQVGIVSWGTGCGVVNTYGYYTHVQELVDWVTNNIPPKN